MSYGRFRTNIMVCHNRGGNRWDYRSIVKRDTKRKRRQEDRQAVRQGAGE